MKLCASHTERSQSAQTPPVTERSRSAEAPPVTERSRSADIRISNLGNKPSRPILPQF
jgi:hypothetical protein